MITNINPQLGQASLYATLFNYNNWGQYAYNLNRDWGQVVLAIQALNGNKSRPVADPNGLYRKAIRRRVGYNAQISAASTASGINLIVTFTDPQTCCFRLGDIVRDTNWKYGRVIAQSAGTITIEPHNSTPATFSTSTDFTIGLWVYKLYDVSGNFYSAGKTNLFEDLDFRSNYTSVRRDSYTMARREKFNTFMGQNGTAYYWTEGERQMAERFPIEYVWKCFFSIGGTQNSQYQGTINGTEGFRQACINQGTFYRSTVPLTRTMWESMIITSSNSSGASSQSKIAWMGRAAWMRVSSFYVNNITFTGSSRILGGNAVNLDVPEITVGGIKVKVFILDFLNDPVRFRDMTTLAGHTGTMMGNTIFIMNENPIPAVGPNEMHMLPSVEKFHFSNDMSNTTAEQIWKVIPGMTGPRGNDTGPTLFNNYQMTANNIDGLQFEVLDDSGIDCIADDWVWWEPAI